MATQCDSSGNSKALLSCDRLRFVNGPERESVADSFWQGSSSALAHVFEHAIGAGQAVNEGDTVASQERHPLATFR
jgi:hypothetical protein